MSPIDTAIHNAALIAAFARANPAAARAVFETAIASAATTEQADDLRLQCEYHCNPTFRKALENHTANLNGLCAPWPPPARRNAPALPPLLS